MGGDDDNDCAGYEIGSWHFGVLFIEKIVDEETCKPSEACWKVENCDGRVKIDLLYRIPGLIGLF